MNEVPKISIIVAVFNSMPFLRQCIGSLLEQTLQDIEVILMNDGSTDLSGVICDEYAAKDPRVKVIHQINGGPSNARNNGLKAASAPYITYVDGDDWLDHTTCERALYAMEKNKADVVFWGLIKEYEGRKGIKVSLFDKERVFDGQSMQWLHRRMVGMMGNEMAAPTKTDAFNSGWGKLYKKNVITENGIYFYDTQEIGSEDVLFNIQVFYFVKRAVYIPYFFSHYRQDNMNSITKSYKSTLFSKFLNLFHYIQLFIDGNKLSKEYRLALTNRIALSVINVFMAVSSPNNPASVKVKVYTIQDILAYPLYYSAIQSLSLRYLPVHWKLFFLLCKWQFGRGVYVLTLLMRRLRKGFK